MVNWDEVQKALSPIKNFEELCHRFKISFGYPCVYKAFNFSLPELESFTRQLLGGDSRQRYTEYTDKLTGIMEKLHHAGVENIIALVQQTADRAKFEAFTTRTQIPAIDIAIILKYLAYWVIPSEKYLSGLVRDEPVIQSAIKTLAETGIRTNLQLLQAGISPSGRMALAIQSGLSPTVISNLVNRADLSRMPWASKATISNLSEAGYGSLARLANADQEQLFADFFAYGKSIGKNLKLGNEIENSFRIARILPILVQEA